MPFQKKRLPLDAASKKSDATVAEPEKKKVEPELVLTPPIEDVILKLRKIILDDIPLRKLKDFYNDMRQAVQEVGEYIDRRDQEEALLRCAVCGNPIRNHPMGSMPGYDLKTNDPILLYLCSTTCFERGRQEIERKDRERLESRNANNWKVNSRYAPKEVPNG